MRHFLLAFVMLCSAAHVKAADAVELDLNPTLFSVMTALTVAGYAPNQPLGGDAIVLQNTRNLRAALQNYFTDKNLPSVTRLQEFYRSHRKPDPTADLNQYISFALSVKGAPDFAFRFKAQEVPPDAEALEGFAPLLASFYEEAKLAELWPKVRPVYEQWLESYQAPVTKALFEVNGYLRNPTSGFLGRRFVVYIEPLGPPNQIQARSYGDDYFLVLTPSLEPQINDVRHAYLHYLLDPLSLKYAQGVLTKQGLRDYADAAPALDDSYKKDFLLLTTESLIKAVEARLSTGGAAKRQDMVNQALREGFVITPAFYELLVAYEAQPSAMRLYYRDLIEGINLSKEEKRLDKVEFAAGRSVRRAKVAPAPEAPVLSPVEKLLQEADDEMYVSKNLERSKELYLQSLSKTDRHDLHARAYYGMGRIALQQKRPEDAEKLLTKAIELKADGPQAAWAHVYLGRLIKASTDPDAATEAAKHFQAALAVRDITDEARKLAEQGLAATRPH